MRVYSLYSILGETATFSDGFQQLAHFINYRTTWIRYTNNFTNFIVAFTYGII